MRMHILAAGLAASLLAAPALAQDAKTLPGDDDQVVITIDGDAIHMARVQAALDAYAQDLGQLDPQAFYLTVLDRVIDQELAARAAVQAGYLEDPSVAAQLAQARANVLAGAYLTRIGAEATSEVELRRRYEAMAKEGVKTVRARHILVKTSAEAKDLIGELDAGGDFEALAKQHSIGPSASRGGDLGFFGQGQMVKPFQDAAFALEKGAYTKEPVETRFGWHVIFVEDIRAEPPPPFYQAQAQLAQEARTQAMIKKLEDLRRAADVRRFTPDGTPLDPETESKPK